MSEITAYAGDLVNTEDMTIAENLDRIINAKEAIKEAIVAKGGQVAEDARIDQYPAAIEGLPSASEYMKFIEGTLTEINIPYGCTKIKDNCFASNTSKIKVNIPDTVLTIGKTAFYNCNIDEIVIPENVTFIDTQAFTYNNNTRYTDIIFKAKKCQARYSGTVDAITQNTYIGNVTIGDEVTIIPQAFLYHTYTPNGFRPNGTIGTDNESDIKLPNTLTDIKEMAFNGMNTTGYLDKKWLKTVVLPDSVKNIENRAFADNKELTSIIIGPNINNLGYYLFEGDTKLTEIIIKSLTPPSTTSYTFSGWPTDITIYVPDESVEIYQTAANWSSRAAYIKPISEKPTE